MNIDPKYYRLEGRSLISYMSSRIECAAAEAAWNDFTKKHFPDSPTARPLTFENLYEIQFAGILGAEPPTKAWKKYRGVCIPALEFEEGMRLLVEVSGLPSVKLATEAGVISVFRGQLCAPQYSMIGETHFVCQAPDAPCPLDAVEVPYSAIIAASEEDDRRRTREMVMKDLANEQVEAKASADHENRSTQE
jgi:hypothetical protein